MVAALSLLLITFLAAATTFEDSFRAGLLALQANDLNAAEINLQTAAQMQPDNGRVWVALAQTYRKAHQDSKAEEAAGKAAKLAPQDATVLQSLAIYYWEAGATAKAAEAQMNYASLAPNDPNARARAEALCFEAAQPLLQQQKFADAIQLLEPATAKLPNSAQLELALGVAYYGLRRFNDAADAFLKAIAIAPEIEQPYLFLGRFLDQIPERVPELTKHFIAWEAAHPSSYTGYFLHARALDAQSIEPEKAVKLLEKALALNDSDASAHFELGTVFDRLQRFPEAAREFDRAAALNPSDPAPHYRLSRDYDRLGKHEEAQAERHKHARLTQAQDAAR